MSIFSSKDFTAANSTRIRNMIAARTSVPAPATLQQVTDFVTAFLQRETKAYEDDVARAAVNNAVPD